MLNKFEEKKHSNQQKKDIMLFSIIIIILIPIIFYVNLYNIPQNDGLDMSETPVDIVDTSINLPDMLINSPEASIELPGIYIMCEKEIDPYNYITCLLAINNAILPCNIKIRGTSVATLAKKGYRLEFGEMVSLFGMREDDDWLLFASYLDHTRMRYKLAFDIWNSLQENNPTAILPNSKYVKLFINNQFQGIYLLTEKADKKLFGLDNAQNNTDTSLIFQVKFHHYNFKENGVWEQDYPNEDEGIFVLNDILTELTDFINKTSDHVFFNVNNGIFSKFDKKNLIDFYLFNFFILHRDFWSCNYYLVRNTNPSKFSLIPWDFDGCFGQLGWREYDYTKVDTYYRNLLWDRLMKNKPFIEELKERWKDLRENLWTEDFMIFMLEDIYKDIKDALEFEMEIWGPITIEGNINRTWPDMFIYGNEDFNLEEKINSLKEWISNRLEFCDSYFGTL